MSYRPICDVWWLARCKYKGGIKRYGGYLGGFPERARVLIGCPLDQPLLHVCGGLAKLYPYRRGFGQHDKTMDLDPSVSPDFQVDCRDKEWPSSHRSVEDFFGGHLMDPPYSELDSEQYSPGRDAYPNPHQLVETSINNLRVGYKTGIIHYVTPRCPKNAMFVASIAVRCGFGNRERQFSVFERIT